MFKYSISFKGEESSLSLEASSENSPSVSYSLNASDRGLQKLMDKYVDFSWSPKEIMERVNRFPSVTMVLQSSEATPTQTSSEEDSKDEEGLGDSKQGFRYSWGWNRKGKDDSSSNSSSEPSDENSSEDKIGD